jgi:hypothetical protein
MSMFQKAEKKQGKLRIALMGPSGSGKTYSALLLAAGIGKRIAVIDTENRSAADYADKEFAPGQRFVFDMVAIDKPYTVQKYIAALEAADAEGYDVVIVDSITHAWAGEGGLLQKKEAMDVRGGNQYTNWAPITKEHEQFKAMLLNYKRHLIATMRSKQDYVIEINERGKSAPRKVGMAPIQREGMEYEFTVAFDLGMDHNATTSKDRTGLFDAQVFRLTAETGRQLLAWRLAGAPETEPQPVPAAPAANGSADKSVAELVNIGKSKDGRLKALDNEGVVYLLDEALYNTIKGWKGKLVIIEHQHKDGALWMVGCALAEGSHGMDKHSRAA